MQLEKATIINRQTNDQIKVMFNPEEYSLEQSNTNAEVGIPGLQKPPIQYVRGNLRTLKMELFFDTYEVRYDVRVHTRQLTQLLEIDATLNAPPILLFTWGRFNFQCVLDSASQKYTMFLGDGTPVRATLSVTFKEFEPIEIQIERGFFIGPPSIRNMVEGKTLSGIAGEEMGDPGAWREIADQNDIDNPRKIPPGTRLIVPPGRRLTRPR